MTLDMRMASMMPTTLLTMMKAALYSNVFRTMMSKSLELNTYSKFLNPTHGLRSSPSEARNVLNAEMMPPIGI